MIEEACAPDARLRVGRSFLRTRAGGADGADLAACVLPLSASADFGLASSRLVAAVFARPLADMASFEREAMTFFDLTAEAKFASALAQCYPLPEAAAQQGVRISTARTHLSRIFQKTGTRQQSQAVALLRNIALPLN